MINLKGKKVLIMGLGIIGKGLKDALFFYDKGSIVTVTDLKTESELGTSIDELKNKDIKLHLGKHIESDFIENDIIVRNPAIPDDSKFLQIAKRYNKKIIMDESYAITFTDAKVIGITGTRGKTTTSTLIYEILKYAKRDAYLSGNIRGTATLPLIEKLRKNSYLVLELSSWQLEGFRDEKISPEYSIITNIYSDHLNRYKSMDDYVLDKKYIYKFQDKNGILFINKDRQDKYFKQFKKEASGRVIYFSKNDCRDYNTNLIGDHNLENIACARKVALELGISEETIKKAISNFKGIEFRLENITEINGISFINDSASTSPDAGIMALNSFDKKVLFICGGATKNLPLDDFAESILKKAKKVALLKGDDSLKLKKILDKENKDLVLDIYSDFEKAVYDLYKIAIKKDIILLSPGCASFGLFINEFDRGNQFNKIVNKIKNEI
ncbi:MAG: UDP-N-acetylmuramoyl-L-alanine--D-glutamate ligase [Patescibacteria group bacterium]|nr:UDP-N-acetylmuramoyl-L-alanine--D-glutamate ligase [Patescibacteria group bacterium]